MEKNKIEKMTNSMELKIILGQGYPIRLKGLFNSQGKKGIPLLTSNYLILFHSFARGMF